ncbi:hypothetical protein [Streptomyces sp. NPDC060194]|uniref:hypothetical protein n=1 Tax=Streptomyces sp. NPDC060194 TaxID=3347069 RepID=UPI0036698044
MVRDVRGRGAGGAAGVAAVVLSVLGTTGCSVDGAAAEDRMSGERGATLVRGAAERLVRAGTARTRTSMEMASGGTRVTIRGEGAYDFRSATGRLEVVLPADPAGVQEHRPITEMLAPGALYMKNRGAGVPADKWVRIETAGLNDGNLVTGGATDPMVAAELLRAASDVDYVGEKRVGGTEVRHFRGTADLGRAAKEASPGARGPLAAAARGFARDLVRFDAYLDEEGRLRKVRHRFSFSDGMAAGGTGAGGRAMEVASTTLLDGFGTRTRWRLPAEEDIFAGTIAER